ncbi:hypothetical protein H5410_044898 [Solanum commersonii]|uniref:Uncharacterized protein n=1 Tax=Solanum commersonii TaxID=4109 RepID=A0A9J5XC60_SOLCO|nr:hypothetical protein H5410_044898 [Solanum commersonii]
MAVTEFLVASVRRQCIALRHNGSYDDMIASVIEADSGIDGSRPTLKINVNVRPLIETNKFI